MSILKLIKQRQSHPNRYRLCVSFAYRSVQFIFVHLFGYEIVMYYIKTKYNVVIRRIMLEDLFLKSRNFIDANNLDYERYFVRTKQLAQRLSIIVGARGIGKTTAVAQYIKRNAQENEALFIRKLCKTHRF